MTCVEEENQISQWLMQLSVWQDALLDFIYE